MFLTVTAASVRRGSAPECHCFGQLNRTPTTWRTVARNTIFVFVAVAAVACGQAAAGADPFVDIGPPGGASTVVALALGATAALAAGALSWFVLGLLRQHGRLLLRLDG